MWNEIKQYYLQRHPLNAPLKKSNLNNKLSKNKSLNDLFLEKTKKEKLIARKNTKSIIKVFSSNKSSYNILKKYTRHSKNKIKVKKFPVIINSNSVSNIRNTNIKIRRKILFSDSNYPLSINDSNNNLIRFSMTNSVSYIFNNNNIIEELDDEKKMIKFLPNDAYYVLYDEFKFSNKDYYNFITNKLIEYLKNKYIQYDKIMLSKNFLLGKNNNKEEVILNLYSFCIKLLDLENNEIQSIFLPLNIIALYYSLSYDNFLFFISKIIESKQEENIININEEIIKEITFNLINSDIDLFENDSNFFFNKSEFINTYPFIKKDKILKIQIIPPKIELIKNNISIYKFGGKGLLIYIIKNNFINWEIPCLCYLTSFKIFRQSISKLFYKENILNKIILDIDKEICKKNIFIKPKNNKDFFYQYFKDKINYINLTSYKINIIVDEEENIFETSFFDLKILYKLSRKYNIKDIIYKCSLINTEKKTVFFSLNVLNGIKINKLDNFFYKFDEDKINNIQIRIRQPSFYWLEIIKFNNLNKILKYNLILDDEILDNLVKLNFFEWNTFFSHKNSFLNKKIYESELKQRYIIENSFIKKSKTYYKSFNKKNQKKIKSNKIIESQ